jgi:hypothetical protein
MMNVRALLIPTEDLKRHVPARDNWHIRYLGVYDKIDYHAVYKDGEFKIWGGSNWDLYKNLEIGYRLGSVDFAVLQRHFPVLIGAPKEPDLEAFNHWFEFYPRVYTYLDQT